MARRKSFCVGSEVAKFISETQNVLIDAADCNRKRMEELLKKNFKSTLKKRIVRL